MKLLSIIMPTRSGSHDSLRKAVRSILDAPGTKRDDVEILLRLDDDDLSRLAVATELIQGVGRIFIGPRGKGYIEMGTFVNDLVKIADSQWCWLFDDDAWVEGNWHGPLSVMPRDCALNTQAYKLGQSHYLNGVRGGCVGMLIPTDLAKTINHVNPVDQQWHDIITQKGWTFRQLNATVYHHDGRAR